MTSKEKLIVKILGYTTFTLYSYIKSNERFSNKEMEFDLGFSKESRYRALKKLRKCNIITVSGHSFSRKFAVNKEDVWKINV